MMIRIFKFSMTVSGQNVYTLKIQNSMIFIKFSGVKDSKSGIVGDPYDNTTLCD